MRYGPASYATLYTVDTTAPGAPSLSIQQNNDDEGEFTLNWPMMDADGTSLTGLRGARAVVIEADEEMAAAYCDDFEAALLVNGAQPFSIVKDESNDPVTLKFVIPRPGAVYSVIAQCTDEDSEA
jgi:hypothetical protein